jgi:hypothetical protein
LVSSHVRDAARRFAQPIAAQFGLTKMHQAKLQIARSKRPSRNSVTRR